MSETTIMKSTLSNPDNEIEVLTTFQTKTTIVNNNTEYDKVDDEEES